MINLKDIYSWYPKSLHGFGIFLMKEYLQYKILEAIYQSPLAGKLIFIGGTCLRMVHGTLRFSEDLDFDSMGCTAEEWAMLEGIVRHHMEANGFEVETQTVSRQAWHCYLRFPGLLYQEGLSGYQQQKILIQIDMEPQQYSFQPELVMLNKFDVFTEILVAPVSLLMSQKCHAILNRKRNKGRDFYDLSFLMSKQVQPDWDFLAIKDGLHDPQALRHALVAHCRTINMREMADDVAPFLFNTADVNRVLHFEKMVQSYW